SIKDYENVRTALKEKDIEWEAAELTMIPSSYVKLQGAQAKQVLSLVESLEEHDDVQNVYANFDIPDGILQQHTK
ncbi:MAG: YebC/PmpR family DNA-binding transcriptional regulator, partial [Candidatus Omnitrophica bacterium]|nr:YebC/PmpR family DNA-binding transcriptional regulator [Candidatus Omnitrophota bacterium]